MTFKIKCERCSAASINGIPCHENGCFSSFVYTDEKGREYQSFRVWTLDVWGNTREGFEVNDRSELKETLLISKDANDVEIIKTLKNAGLLNKRCRFNSFSVGGDDKNMSIDARKSGEPIYQLEAN